MLSKAARRYTLALYGVAEEQGKLNEVINDINFIINLMESNRGLTLFFLSPIINKNKKLIALKEIFQNNISELMMNFINLLAERRREGLIPDITVDFLNLRNQKQGIVDVDVKTSVGLNDEEKARMKQKIDAYTHLKSNLNFKIDKSIIGGFVAKIDDTILDASIKRQLEILKEKFKHGDFVLN